MALAGLRRPFKLMKRQLVHWLSRARLVRLRLCEIPRLQSHGSASGEQDVIPGLGGHDGRLHPAITLYTTFATMMMARMAVVVNAGLVHGGRRVLTARYVGIDKRQPGHGWSMMSHRSQRQVGCCNFIVIVRWVRGCCMGRHDINTEAGGFLDGGRLHGMAVDVF